MATAIARIESYKHYQAGAVHKEAVRELHGYKNPNYNPERSSENYYFERMQIDKPFEQWIYDYRQEAGITGRYIEHSKNPKSETNAMCQALFCVPTYIRQFCRADQIQILKHCYDFFRQEFPDVPVLEAVCHFDETEPHLQIDFLPVVERLHAKRGKEKIFSTTQLMPGAEFFPQFQDRFYQYMEDVLCFQLERTKGSKAKHLTPKEYREVTAELESLSLQKSQLEYEKSAIEEDIEELKECSGFDKQLSLFERIRDLEFQNNLFRKFLSYVFEKYPILDSIFRDFWRRNGRSEHELNASRQAERR